MGAAAYPQISSEIYGLSEVLVEQSCLYARLSSGRIRADAQRRSKAIECPESTLTPACLVAPTRQTIAFRPF